jgi:hypothetical protein
LAQARSTFSNGFLIWIVGPLVLIVVANLTLFSIYQQANPAQDFYSQLWDYLQSQSFLAITGSLLFPIAIFLVENRLQIIQKRADEKKELRVKCMQSTEELWAQLQSLAFEVSNFDATTGAKADALKIIGRVHDFKNSGEQTVGDWTLRFPDLEQKCLFDILTLVDVVSDPAYAIAYRLLDAPSDASTPELQNYLGTIADVVDGIVRYSIIKAFSLSIEIDDPATSRLDRKQKEKEKQNLLALLNSWASGVRDINQRFINVGPFMSGPDVDNLRRTFVDVEAQSGKNQPMGVNPEGFAKLMAAYDKLTPAERGGLFRYGINGTSVERLKQTAGWLSTEWLRIEIEQRIKIKDGQSG